MHYIILFGFFDVIQNIFVTDTHMSVNTCTCHAVVLVES